MKCSVASLCALVAILFLSSPTVLQATDKPNKSEYCKIFEAAQSDLARLTGSRVDAVTKLLKVTVHCAQRTFLIRQRVRVPTKRLRSDWVERRHRAWARAYCAPGSEFRDAILEGWHVQTEIATVDGLAVKIVAQCFDAMA